MTIKIYNSSDFPVGKTHQNPSIVFSKKNTIVLSSSLCAALKLDASHDHVLFGYDKDFPTDLYIIKAEGVDIEEAAFTVLDRRIQASEGKEFALHVKRSLGLDTETGWKFPVKPAKDGWFQIGVKRAASTDKRGGRK